MSLVFAVAIPKKEKSKRYIIIYPTNLVFCDYDNDYEDYDGDDDNDELIITFIYLFLALITFTLNFYNILTPDLHLQR